MHWTLFYCYTTHDPVANNCPSKFMHGHSSLGWCVTSLWGMPSSGVLPATISTALRQMWRDSILFVLVYFWKGPGISRRKALLPGSACSSGSRLCLHIAGKNLCRVRNKPHSKLLFLMKREKCFNSFLDLRKYYLFSCIVLNKYMQFWSMYFRVLPKELLYCTLCMQWQRTKAYLLVLDRTAFGKNHSWYYPASHHPIVESLNFAFDFLSGSRTSVK